MTIDYVVAPPTVYYPESDGMPMAESDFQRGPLTYAIEALESFFANRPDVYVSGDIFVYYEEGKPDAVVAPDVLVAFGVPKRQRPSYFVWKEGKFPDFILEITSKSTRVKDQGPKRGTYAFLGAQEYFQYDPTQDYLDPPLQGLKLVGREYQPIPVQESPDGILMVPSEVLGLEVHLKLAVNLFRFFDPIGQQYLLSYDEAQVARGEAEATRREAEERAAREAAARREVEAAWREAEKRADQAAAARQAAEAELERLRAELARLQGRSGE
jgi:Uma2 family endonuclease